MTEIKLMWDGKLKWTIIEKLRIERTSSDTHSVHCVPQCTVQKVLLFERIEIEKIIEMNVLEPSQTEWAALIVVPLMKDDPIRFRVDHQKMNNASLRKSYPILRMNEYIVSPGEGTVFLMIAANSSTAQFEFLTKKKVRRLLNRTTAFQDLSGYHFDYETHLGYFIAEWTRYRHLWEYNSFSSDYSTSMIP